VLPLSPAQDFKRIGDGDTGPNTGGMGAYSPVPMVDTTMTRGICEHMLQPIIDGMSDRGMPFVGLLYAGLVLTADGPKVLEYNARFGDPETQVVLPRMTTDLAHLLWSAADGNVVEQVKFSDDAAVTVVAASRGYPQAPMTGTLIERLDVAESTPGALVFHAGIREQDGRFYSDGGRVLSVTGLGHTLQEARQISYHALDSLAFEGMQFRTDIAAAASSI
jgi:phosphoribosylamine--glycine ligase